MTEDSVRSFPSATSVTPARTAIAPQAGEVITSVATGNTFIMGEKIGEGFFGVVYACKDVWDNDLAAKVLKPIGTYETVRAAAEGEIQRLLTLRHPNITYVYDAFEFRDTFYIITERCYCPVTQLFSLSPFDGRTWLMPIARCLLQAIQYLHRHKYAHQDIHAGNVFTAFARDEMRPKQPGSIHFKLGDLGVAKLFDEIDASNTRAEGMLPPEAIDAGEFGPLDSRVDIYHIGLLLLQLAKSQATTFSRTEIIDGRPRERALELEAPLSFALEKALRRHVSYRTASALELWRDLHSPVGSARE